MNNNLKSLCIILLINFSSVTLFSQSDSTKLVSKEDKINNEINDAKGNYRLTAKSATSKVKPSSNYNLKIEEKLNTSAINKRLKKIKSNNKNQHFLLEELPENSDIIGKKYWKGKDVTHKKLVSTYSLGTIRSTTTKVRIETRDHSYIDGDRIKIYLNEKVVSSNVGLKGNYYVIYLSLEHGYNRIDFQALNQGFSGPNTAEFRIYDDNGNLLSAKEWNLTTGQTATMGIIKN
ncbi:MAG: hypothetical protein COB01_03735 [Lutibacter sp.]|nr:MAG: hypothetical protein COB01_03735 [Lutibacter sp.]